MIARFARFVALMLLAWQAVAVQAHAHGWPAAAQAGVSVSASIDRGSDVPLDCPVCRIAQAGQFVSPGGTAFLPPEALPAWRAPVTLAVVPHLARSHTWRSRAPPSPLPA